MLEIAELYNQSASSWQRQGVSLLSDFTARSHLLEFCGFIDGTKVLDVGCGEGYCSRFMKIAGAKSVLGLDISREMINRARESEEEFPLQNVYRIGSAIDLSFAMEKEYDLVTAVFLYNYLTYSEMERSMKEVFRVLRSGGNFVFFVPHPLFPFLRQVHESPFYFDGRGVNYFKDRDRAMLGKIWHLSGRSVEVLCIHKRIDDYLSALQNAGFNQISRIAELGVTDEHLRINPVFFSSLESIPLHVAFQAFK